MGLMKSEHPHINKLLLQGISWRGAAEVFRSIWTLVVLVILASLLEPEDFGIVGMTDVIIAVFIVIMEMGFDAAIVQAKHITQEVLSTIFWINVGLGGLLAIVATLLSPLLGVFFNESQVIPIVTVLSTSFIFQSLWIVQRGLLERKLAFQKIAIVNATTTFISSIIAIIIAVRGGGFWSLVVFQLGKSFFSILGFWKTGNWKPSIVFNLGQSKGSIKFGINILTFNILNMITTKLDTLLIGRFLGAESLGFYIFAQRLVARPISLILGVIGRTLYPVLSSIQSNRNEVRKVYSTVIQVSFYLLAPFILAVALVSPDLIPFQLGPNWRVVVPIVIVFSFGALIQIIASRSSILMLTFGRPDLHWKYQLVVLPVVLVSILIGMQFGTFGVSLGYNVANTLVVFLALHLSFSLIDLKISTFTSYFKFSLIALFFQLIAGLIISFGLRLLNLHPYFSSIILAILSIGIYISALIMLDTNAKLLIVDLWRWIREKRG